MDLVTADPAFSVAEATAGSQFGSVSARLSNGNVVVVWVDDNPAADASGHADADGFGIKARIFDTAGNALGHEFVVNQTTGGAQTAPAVTALQDGGFAVSWTDPIGPVAGHASEIELRAFDSDGSPRADEAAISATSALDRDASSIAEMADGRLAVVWQEQHASGMPGFGYADPANLVGRIAEADGTAATGELLLQTSSSDYVTDVAPHLAALAGGGFALAWTQGSTYQGFPGFGLTLQSVEDRLFTADGAPASGLIDVAHAASSPSVAQLSDGRLVEAWTSYGGTYSSDVDVAFVNADGTVGAPFSVAPSSYPTRGEARVVALDGDHFAVVWAGEGGSADMSIHGQLFDGSGARDGDAFVVGGSNPGMIAAVSGGFVVPFTTSDASNTDLFARIFHLTPYDDLGAGQLPTDVVAPDPGHNVIDGRPGVADAIVGTDATDTVSYAGATSAVVIDLNAGATWDGTVNDTLSGIENGTGSAFDDVLMGDAGNNVLDGGTGAPTRSGAVVASTRSATRVPARAS